MTTSLLLRCAFGCFFLGLFGCDSEPQGPEPEDEQSAQPPEPVAGAPAGDGAGVMLALTRLRVGTHTPDGETSSEAWQAYGYDLDGVITHGSFDGHCEPAFDADPSVAHEDGLGGVDNAFGKTLLPLLRGVSNERQGSDGELEQALNATLGAGGTDGLLVHLRDLGDQPSYGSISAFGYGLRKSSEDQPWAVSPESLSEPETEDFDQALLSAELGFADSYVSDGVYVGRASEGVLELTWLVSGAPLVLRVHRPIVTVELSGISDGSVRGVLAGVLDAEEAEQAARDWMARIDPSFCDGTAVEGIVRQVRAAADLMRDGSQDPRFVCDGISFGVGLELTASEVSSLAEPRALPLACSEI